MRVVGYTRVSTADQEHGIDAQRASISAEAVKRGWEVVWFEDEGKSGKGIDRAGVREALRILKAGEASAMVAAKLDRLSRSLPDFARLLEVSGKEGWSIVALDLNLDTSTPAGKLVASIMASVAQMGTRGDRRAHEGGARRSQGQGHPHRPTRQPGPCRCASHPALAQGRPHLPGDRRPQRWRRAVAGRRGTVAREIRALSRQTLPQGDEHHCVKLPPPCGEGAVVHHFRDIDTIGVEYTGVEPVEPSFGDLASEPAYPIALRNASVTAGAFLFKRGHFCPTS